MSNGRIKGNYGSGNATDNGTVSYPQTTGSDYKDTGAKLKEASDHPREFGLGKSKGRGIFNGS
jgi:hypothetical protein